LWTLYCNKWVVVVVVVWKKNKKNEKKMKTSTIYALLFLIIAIAVYASYDVRDRDSIIKAREEKKHMDEIVADMEKEDQEAKQAAELSGWVQKTLDYCTARNTTQATYAIEQALIGTDNDVLEHDLPLDGAICVFLKFVHAKIDVEYFIESEKLMIRLDWSVNRAKIVTHVDNGFTYQIELSKNPLQFYRYYFNHLQWIAECKEVNDWWPTRWYQAIFFRHCDEWRHYIYDSDISTELWH